MNTAKEKRQRVERERREREKNSAGLPEAAKEPRRAQ